MRIYGFKIIFHLSFFVFLVSQSFVFGQEKSQSVNLQYILRKLTFTSRISKSNEKINQELIEEIQAKKVDFILSAEDEKSLTEAGGTSSLIKAIRENLPKIVEENLKYFKAAEDLYQKILDNYQNKDFQKLKISLAAAKEFIEKYGDEKSLRKELSHEMKESLKSAVESIKFFIPRLEDKITNWFNT